MCGVAACVGFVDRRRRDRVAQRDERSTQRPADAQPVVAERSVGWMRVQASRDPFLGRFGF
jgi:hypothetical protein